MMPTAPTAEAVSVSHASPNSPQAHSATTGLALPQRAPQEVLRAARRIVVKVGSSLVTNEGRGLDAQAIGQW